MAWPSRSSVVQRCGSTHGQVKAGGEPSCFLLCSWQGGLSYSNCLPLPVGAGCYVVASNAALHVKCRCTMAALSSGCSKRLSLLLGAQHHTR